ncbi:endonuclease/exonuclease/phosphatase family protein [Nakamurella sp.]|uniref:endonuclease/exonuclease/phosphatase family protein n=1 Tax=Nakamurella sp. TaxID=1869182 RepID=UPI003B3A1278
MGVQSNGTAALAGLVIGGAALVQPARWLRVRGRADTAVVTLASVSLLPAAAAELTLVAGRRWTAAGVGAVVLAAAAAVHAPLFRRTAASAAIAARSIDGPEPGSSGTPAGAPTPDHTPTADHGPGAAVRLTVMTANLLHGRADVEALARTAERHDVDVLCVQEVHPGALNAIGRRVAGQLPHRHIRGGFRGAGTGIFSRHPLVDGQLPDGYGFPPVVADVLVPTSGDPRRVGVMSFHSKAPVGNGGARYWADDLARLGRLMAAHPGPLIVAGDFNATHDHRQFRDLLTGGYHDAAADAGAGFVFTFPAHRFRVPIAGLDHVVLSRELVGLDVRSARQPGTDHKAVIARVALT